MRWHKILHGRIVASCEAVDGDAADAILDNPNASTGFIVSDDDWRAMQYRRRLQPFTFAYQQVEPYPILPTRTLHRLSTR